MGLYTSDGTRVTKSNISTSAVPDPEKVLGADLWQKSPYSPTDPKPEGGKKTLFARAGAVLRQSQIDAMFPAPTVSAVSPATGSTTGGTVVTLTGTNLDGVTGVTFGATAGTALTVLSSTSVRVTTPAKTAGAKDVVVTDDGGTATVTNGFTYA